MIEIASGNVNSIRARLEHVTTWLKARPTGGAFATGVKGDRISD
jgi:hypothetical protein